MERGSIYSIKKNDCKIKWVKVNNESLLFRGHREVQGWKNRA
jgi:hypothetical protein